MKREGSGGVTPSRPEGGREEKAEEPSPGEAAALAAVAALQDNALGGDGGGGGRQLSHAESEDALLARKLQLEEVQRTRTQRELMRRQKEGKVNRLNQNHEYPVPASVVLHSPNGAPHNARDDAVRLHSPMPVLPGRRYEGDAIVLHSPVHARDYEYGNRSSQNIQAQESKDAELARRLQKEEQVLARQRRNQRMEQERKRKAMVNSGLLVDEEGKAQSQREGQEAQERGACGCSCCYCGPHILCAACAIFWSLVRYTLFV